MTGLRRAVAVALVLLVVPSILWLLVNLVGDKHWQPWGKELLLVAACLSAAGAAWSGVRFWHIALLTIAVVYTYVITWPLFTTVLLSSPVKYVDAVTREAARRDFSEGAWLIWSLLVLPAAFPVFCVLAAWVALMARGVQDASAI